MFNILVEKRSNLSSTLATGRGLLPPKTRMKRRPTPSKMSKTTVISPYLYSKIIIILGYGKCGENVRRHKVHDVVVDTDELYKKMAKPRFVSMTEILDENGEPESWEVATRKKTIEDDKPVHFSLAILQYSKLLFLE